MSRDSNIIFSTYFAFLKGIEKVIMIDFLAEKLNIYQISMRSSFDKMLKIVNFSQHLRISFNIEDMEKISENFLTIWILKMMIS